MMEKKITSGAHLYIWKSFRPSRTFMNPFVLIVLIVTLAAKPDNAFSQQDGSVNFDSLSIKDILKMEHPSQYPDIKFDSVCVDLYLKDERIAVMPPSVVSYFDSSRVESKKRTVEKIGNKYVLRIQLLIKENDEK